MAKVVKFASLNRGQVAAYEDAVGKAAGGFEKGTVGYAQFTYGGKRTKAETKAAVEVLTGLKAAA